MGTDVTHSLAVRGALATATLAEIDGESGSALLEFQTAADAEVATLSFVTDAAGAIVNGVITFDTISPDTDATGGFITKFEIQDALGVGCVAGTVSTTGEGINLSHINIANGDTVSVSGLTYTASV